MHLPFTRRAGSSSSSTGGSSPTTPPQQRRNQLTTRAKPATRPDPALHGPIAPPGLSGTHMVALQPPAALANPAKRTEPPGREPTTPDLRVRHVAGQQLKMRQPSRETCTTQLLAAAFLSSTAGFPAGSLGR